MANLFFYGRWFFKTRPVSIIVSLRLNRVTTKLTGLIKRRIIGGLTFVWLPVTTEGASKAVGSGLDLMVFLILGHQSFKGSERAAFIVFNERQLVLARDAASGIELYFETRVEDLRVLGKIHEVQHLVEVQRSIKGKNMNKRFAYGYLMKGEPARIQATVPAHVAYWNERNLQGYLGGPFADRSGGLITFEVENLDEATRIIDNDPFVLENLLEEKWTKEWVVE